VDPELARQGLASAGSGADRVWLGVLAGQPPGLLGGLSAGDLRLKPAAVEAPPPARDGGAAVEAADGAASSLEKLRKAAEDLALRLGMIGGPVPPALPARPVGGRGRLGAL